MNTNNLQSAVKQAYLNLRKAIMECEQHPDDEFYELSEMHANDVYDDALEALILARMEEKRRVELNGELPF
ncbi:MAG: hypothetical protein J6N54_03760 [Bacteroidales bacterium]|nr:hypothetical protein [Bacteroidales bacterium]